jgi:selenocysteine-specific elongation factor
LTADGVAARDGSLVRLPQHAVRLEGDERALVERIRELLAEQPLAPPELPHIERTLGLTRTRLLELIRLLERDEAIVRVAADLYFLRDAIARLIGGMRERFPPGGDVTPAAFRDHFGTSRKYAIPLLEFLDRQGITARIGDVRRMRKPAVPAER